MSAADKQDPSNVLTERIAFVRAIEPDETEAKTDPGCNPWADEEPTVEVIRCPGCGGSGMHGHESIVRGRSERWTVTCEACDGSGEAVQS